MLAEDENKLMETRDDDSPMSTFRCVNHDLENVHCMESMHQGLRLRKLDCSARKLAIAAILIVEYDGATLSTSSRH